MERQRAAGAVIFYDNKKSPRYLLLKHAGRHSEPREYWNFPKGHIEKGETPAAAARREIMEETGLRDFDFVRGFRERERYRYGHDAKKISKSVVWFLARSREKKITLSDEHIGAAWLLYRDARKKVFYPGTRRILQKAHTFIRTRQ